MTSKLRHGNDVYTMLIDIIMDLTPLQAENLYTELLARYTRRAKTKLYNEKGEEDSKGYIRLLPLQYRAIRTKYGDAYMHKAFTELTNYIKYLEAHLEDDVTYKQKLRKLKSETHNKLLASDDGWVYNKCKSFACSDRPRISVNPFLIDDLNTAKEYIKNIPKELRETSMDVQQLLLRFPELACEDNDE